MRKLVFIILLSGYGFANNDWKSLGEYFENKYFDELRNGLMKEKNPTMDYRSKSWLKKAYYMYQTEAKRGNSEAQFRLGVLYRQAGLEQDANKWFSMASALGHYYASESIKENSKLSEASKCSHYSSWLLTDSIPLQDARFHVESLALMGQEECMLALGQRNRSLYWYNRALALVSHALISSNSLFELSSLLEESLGSNHKSVLSLAEWAARRGNSQAEDWLESQVEDNGIRAFASVLKSQNRPLSAEKALKGLHNSLMSKESWSEDDQYSDAQRRKIARLLKSDSKSALLELVEIKQDFIFETIQNTPANFIESMLALYEELGGYETDDAGVAKRVLGFMRLTEPKERSTEKALQLLTKSFDVLTRQRLAEFLIHSQDFRNISSWLSLITAGEIQQALLLRRVLAPTGDVAALDSVLKKSLSVIDSSEESLKQVLEVVQNSGKPDLLLFAFAKIFKNELLQLDVALQIEDLFSGVMKFYEVSPGVLEALRILASLQDSGIVATSVGGFPKLELLRKSGIRIETSKLRIESSLLAEGIFTIQRYRQAYLNFNASRFFEWDYTLGATLSERDLRAIRNQFSSILDRLISRSTQFSGHRREKESFEDSKILKKMAMQSLSSNLVQKKLQLENLVSDLLATQKGQKLETSIDYDSLKNSTGLKTFKVVSAESDSFNVSPADAKMATDFSPIGNSPFFSHKSIRLQKNEVVNIRVSGEWSPVCALKRSGMIKDVSGISVGSEGFRIQASQGQSSTSGSEDRETKSRFKTSSTTHSFGLDTRSLTSGLGAGLGFLAGGPVGAAIGGGIGGLGGYSYSSQTTEGTTESTDTSKFKQSLDFSSTTASFQAGIRLRDTPYPAFPAGSYIAVIISRENTRLYEPIDAFMLGAQSSYVAPEDVELFLVVNDCNNGEISPGKLTVQSQQMKPSGPLMDDLISAMKRELRDFSLQGRALVKEGGDLGLRIETLKSKVFSKLKMDSVVDFMSDPTLRTVFLHWLNEEADKIVRQARILELGRQIIATKLEVDSIEEQITLGGDAQSWVSSRINGLVKTVEHIPLYESILDIVRYANKFITPVLNLYYPNGLSFISKIDSYTHAFGQDDHLSVETLADSVTDLSRQLLKGLGETNSIASRTSEFIMIRIPRPGIILSEAHKEITPVIRDARSKMLWDCLFQAEKCSEDWALQLRFSDLYQNGSQNSLSLHQEAPVIIDMALLFGIDDVLEANYLQTQHPSAIIQMNVGAEQVFPMQNGPRKFMLSNEDLRSHRIRLGFIGSGERILSAIERVKNEITTDLETAKGLSPFSAFQFSVTDRTTLHAIAKDLKMASDGYPDRLTDVFLIMRVVSTNRNKPMDWILR